MSELFTPEYDEAGYPILDDADIQHMRNMQRCGVLQVGDARHFTSTRPVAEADNLDYHIGLLEGISRKVLQVTNNVSGIACGQTILRPEGVPLNIFLATIDPTTENGMSPKLNAFVNFEVTDKSDELQYQKHGCLSTGPMSPVTGTPESISFRSLNRHREELGGELHGFAAAIAWHEYMHNMGQLMAEQHTNAVVNCAPLRVLKLMRATSAEDAIVHWPLRYTTEKVDDIVWGKHTLLAETA